MCRWIVLAAILVWCPALLFAEDTLWVAYLEHPPYSFTGDDGQPAGFLVERTRLILSRSGLQTRWIAMPANRITESFRQQDRLWCSIGWYETPERHEWAKFSSPIHRDKAMVVLTVPRWAERIQQLGSIDKLFQDSTLTWLRLPNASYGPEIDRKAHELKPSTTTPTTSAKEALQMLVQGRGHYMLVGADDLETRLKAAGLDTAAVVAVPMADMPPGNLRYLIFSRNVPDALIERINTAIAAVTPAP